MTSDLRALAKIDAHHHLWDLEHNDYPWLREPGGPRMYGDYRAMCRSYLIGDFLADSARTREGKQVDSRIVDELLREFVGAVIDQEERRRQAFVGQRLVDDFLHGNAAEGGLG